MLKQSLQTMLKQREIQDQQAYDLESQNASQSDTIFQLKSEHKEKESTFKLYRTKIEKQEMELKLN